MGMYNIIINVKRFGPINNTRFRLSPLTIFTGESNLGKSYVNYLTYYLINFLTNKGLQRLVETKLKNKQDAVITIKEIERELNKNVEGFMRNFLRSSEVECNVEYVIDLPGESDLKVSYNIREPSTIVHDDDGKILHPKPILEVSINGKKRIYPGDVPEMKTYYLTQIINNVIQERIFGAPYFPMLLPPSRGAFIGLDYTTTNAITQEGDMYRIFLRDFDMSTRLQQTRKRRIVQIVDRLLGGKLIVEKDKQYLKMTNGSKIPLTAAASSVREISPFFYSMQSMVYPFRSYCFEEPEAHLHPKMQIAVADMLAISLNEDNIFHITTHSDYILQRINQLIKLNYILKENKKVFKELCAKHDLSKDLCINKEDVSVYYFYKTDEGVSVEELSVTDKGLPMKTFFSVVDNITRTEDDINYAIKQIEQEVKNGN